MDPVLVHRATSSDTTTENTEVSGWAYVPSKGEAGKVHGWPSGDGGFRRRVWAAVSNADRYGGFRPDTRRVVPPVPSGSRSDISVIIQGSFLRYRFGQAEVLCWMTTLSASTRLLQRQIYLLYGASFRSGPDGSNCPTK